MRRLPTLLEHPGLVLGWWAGGQEKTFLITRDESLEMEERAENRQGCMCVREELVRITDFQG